MSDGDRDPATPSTELLPVGASRTAVVTGANRGLGRAMAVGLGADGLDVALLGRSREGLEEAAAEVAAHGVRTLVVPADVVVADDVLRAAAVVEEQLGPVDLLVNNAGVIDSTEVPAWEADPDEVRRILEVDLLGPFHCVRAFVPAMVARGRGRVVDLNSGAGAADRENYAAYCAAKAGLFRLGGNLHRAGYDRGVRSFQLSPGTVRTDMTASMGIHAGRTDWVGADEVVALLVAMASGELDAWSGRYVRAGLDTPESLAAAAPGLRPLDRTLGVLPWGADDPLR